jgi:polysaccharide pyruvyl transferase WcaK-like protein
MSLLRNIRSLAKDILRNRKVPSLLEDHLKGNLNLVHISAFSFYNAGDTLLPVVLQDLFSLNLKIKKWSCIQVHSIMNALHINKINHSDGVIIGGGGLFLKDTNANNLSGWQWPCSIENLKKINAPIIMFAVGYNRFRGQEEFDPIFREHLNSFVEQAKFVGIRNYGSINKLKNYIDDDRLKEKLIFQPCMTTVISKMYPDLTDYSNKEDFIALNCAFDRKELRSANDDILKNIAEVALQLSKKTRIKYYSHVISDNQILPYFDSLGVKYELVSFSNVKEMIIEYSKPKLVIGMRGHAQMIPFGCNTPILSIVSHDKLQYFLDDIGHSEWGVDVLDKDFSEKLFDKSVQLYENFENVYDEILIAQKKIWIITKNNLNMISKILDCR